MLKWSSSPVRRLHRFFSAVRYTPGGGVGDVGVIPRRRSTLQRPSTVKKRSVPANQCSFIGQTTAPVRPNCNNSGVFTFLQVKRPLENQAISPIEICIFMNGELAQVAVKYLQQKQYVYVAGCLYTYNKINQVQYRVVVRELNFVRTHSQNEVPCKTDNKLQNEEMIFAALTTSKTDNKRHNEEMIFAASTTNSGSCDVNKEERIREQHILWQIFFANPFEWWDRRARKRSANQPDFKHKSTGEALWIRSDDPPWVKKQLDLYDSEISDTNLFHKKDDYGLQGWKIQDFDHL